MVNQVLYQALKYHGAVEGFFRPLVNFPVSIASLLQLNFKKCHVLMYIHAYFPEKPLSLRSHAENTP